MKHYLPYLPAGLALLSVGNVAVADSYNDYFSAGVERISTSDDLSHDTASLEYKRKNATTKTQYGIRAEKHRFKNPAYKHDGKSVYIQGSTYITPNVQLNAGAGSMRISRLGSAAAKKSFTPYHIGVQAQLGQRAQVSVRQERVPAYIRHTMAGKNGDILIDDTTSIELKTRPFKRVQANLSHQNSKLSDGNRGRKTTAGVYYGVTPNIWVGVEGSQRGYDRQDPSYWTPKKYRSYAATLDASMPLSERSRLNASLKAGRGKEQGVDGQSRTLYASLGADFDVGQNTTVSANVYHDESRRDGKKWHENGAMMNLTYRW